MPSVFSRIVGFWRDYWPQVAGATCLSFSTYMGLYGNEWPKIQQILICNCLALLAHQFEEYIFPGGGPIALNAVLYGERRNYDRFPINKLSSAWINTLAYFFYIPSVFWPDLVWLGLAQTYFGWGQALIHGIIINVKGKTLYNPGQATAVILHLPIGIWYVRHINSLGIVKSIDYVYGIGGFLAATALIVGLPMSSFKSRESRYPFSKNEISRGNMLSRYIASGTLSKEE